MSKPPLPLISPRIASVTLIRNECDIVELFIKINARFLTTMYIVDHHSNDATANIIKALQAQGYPVRYVPWEGLEFQQSMAMNSICHQLAKHNAFDYLLPLDADEFINEAEWPAWQEAARIPSTGYGRLSVRNYCAIRDDYWSATAPLFENFRPRAFEPQPIPRVLLGNEFAKEVHITEGNHYALHPKLDPTAIELSVQLQHVPFRSTQQVIAKTIPAASALRTKTNRMPGEGAHWEVIAQYIMDRDFKLSPTELKNMGLFYPANRKENAGNHVCLDEPGIGRPTDDITMREDAQVNVLRAFSGAIQLLESRLAQRPPAPS